MKNLLIGYENWRKKPENKHIKLKRPLEFTSGLVYNLNRKVIG